MREIFRCNWRPQYCPNRSHHIVNFNQQSKSSSFASVFAKVETPSALIIKPISLRNKPIFHDHKCCWWKRFSSLLKKTMHFSTHPPTSLLVVKYPQEKMFHSKPAPWLTASLKKLGIIYLFCCDSLTKFAPRKKHLSSVAGPTSNLNTHSLSLSLSL